MNAVEKIQEPGQVKKTVEQWLREDVVKICEARKRDSSDYVPIEDFFVPLIAEYEKNNRVTLQGYNRSPGAFKNP